MTKEEFINASRKFIENKDYYIIDKCVAFQNNVIQVVKNLPNADEFAFGITFMEQIITFRKAPKNYKELLESF